MATATQGRPPQKKSDRYDYEFGVDGLMTFSKAAAHLGVSVATLERYAERQYVRVAVHKGNTTSGRRVVCIRSMKDYIASIAAR